MSKLGVAILFLLVISMIVIFLYLFSKYKKQSIQIFTITSFLNEYRMSEIEDQQKSLVERINEFFSDNETNDNCIGEEDGDDGGE